MRLSHPQESVRQCRVISHTAMFRHGMLDFLSRNGSVEPPRIFYKNGDVSPSTFRLLLFLVSVSATFKHDEMHHVDEVLKVMDDEQRARTREDRPPHSFCPTVAGVSLSFGGRKGSTWPDRRGGGIT